MIYRVGPKCIWKRHGIEEENKLIDIHVFHTSGRQQENMTIPKAAHTVL
jgi:hypothetical protein